VTGLLGLDDWADRVAEIGWVIGHEDDLRADFLHIWGIDLDRDCPPAARFFSLARRTFAYSGVMAARVAEEDRRREARPVGRPAALASQTHRAGHAGNGVQEVSLEQLQRMHPDLIEH
jgi:hypothetical protein